MSDLAALLHVRALAINVARALLIIVALFIPIALLERRQGSDTSRYGTRHFAHDVAYALFYQSGVYTVLFASLIGSALQSRLHVLSFNAVGRLPLPVAAVIYWVVADFLSYWVHRAEHAVPMLWQFHSVHHSNERITFLSSFRNHPVEQALINAVLIAPLLVLGVAPHLWLPVYLMQQFFEAVQHAELDWRYGPFYRVLVSPVFHRLHHSADRAHFDRNYGKVFSVWDHLFGTALPERTAPAAIGVTGMPSEPTLLGQFTGPFVRLAGHRVTHQNVPTHEEKFP